MELKDWHSEEFKLTLTLTSDLSPHIKWVTRTCHALSTCQV